MKFFLLLTIGLVWAGTSEEYLPSKKIESIKTKPCTFVHLWATWCTLCVQELPDVLRAMEGWKNVNRVVIDVSTPFEQERFSKRLVQYLHPNFKTYLKPKGPDFAYMQAVDKNWPGALPYSVLYDYGKKKKVWLGSLSIPSLKQEIDGLCTYKR